MTLTDRRVLLIIAGGIAAYKSLDLIRRLREQGAAVRCILTQGAQHFVTPLAAASLSEDHAYTELFSLKDEAEMGHIRLSREADLIVVAPATADLMAKMAHGLADDLASTALLATDKPVLIAPAMNPMMWAHAATKRNLATLRDDGIHVIGPTGGDMACGEVGTGRMAEPLEIVDAVAGLLTAKGAPLAGKHALVTSGPTYEAIDPVRFIGNRSSGKQGHAIAKALADAGARVTLVTGPVALPDPQGVAVVHIESARDMRDAALEALPADVAVCAAAVADWRPVSLAEQKMKKTAEGEPPRLELTENPDILRTLAQEASPRPTLVIGFAAETENLIEHAKAKLGRKGCDWILANDVGSGTTTFGGDANTVHLLKGDGSVDAWPSGSKADIAKRLVDHIARALDATAPQRAATLS